MTAKDESSSSHDRLRAALRDADPLRPEGMPAAEDVRQLRARVLASASEGGRSEQVHRWRRAGAMRQALAILAQPLPAAAMLLVVAIAAAWLLRSPRVERDPLVGTAQIEPPASAPADRNPRDVPRPDVSSAADPLPDARGEFRPAQPPHRSRVAPRAQAEHASVGGAEERAAAPVQLQFTTPGGTQIVWVVNPNLRLPAGTIQQEDPRCAGE